ncbi:heterokaryon incompatibility protein-domain-containing protein [Ilyonectria robusta]|uniref:heterokaryon incompatibility protein-domain-containing protein n=1 Tax=Ilyonectria robusta TaxID=1079257 RepID=UPI001E8CAA22|nr:heterokaryon incompatibility protein-domain-containing protein [Ilyonectria robusta]KAH8721650.1 heterokaryon incompatibility protein-domain-containing protein [Ilyonectria robusta]
MSDMVEMSPASRDEYKYIPIEQTHSIRLLELQPATSWQSPIEVSLREYSLDACPEFGALSYTWATEDGDSSLSKCLECGGGIIKITANCEAALVRLRQSEEVRVLWVDAICIDQSNDAEKNLQITLMRQIYSLATWVGLWLGEASTAVDEQTSKPLSELGMTFMHDFAVEIAERSNSGQTPYGGELYQEFIGDRRAFQEQGMEVFTPRVQGFWDVLHRPWWERLWVVQELALSQSAHLMCGGSSESWHNLTVVIDGLVKSDGQSVEVFEFIATFITSAFHQIHMASFVDRNQPDSIPSQPPTPGTRALAILNATRNTRATDPRDKIYGILGFFGDAESDPENIFPLPDYTKTAAELYADVSRSIIANTCSLDVMSSCYGFVKSAVPDLPSWAAAWNDTPLKYFDEGPFNTSNGSSAIYEASGDSWSLLRIKGKRVDSVKFPSPTPDEIHYDNQIMTQLWRQWTELAFSLPSYPTGEAIADVLLNTLCWGSNLALDRLAPGEYRETFDAWLKILRSPDTLEVASEKIFTDETAYTYSRRISFLTWARVLGTTTNSKLALLPMSAEVGDEIVIFNGGKLPFVVRSEGDNFKVVGPCYVHGIMDGEAFPMNESESGEWFSLC